MLSRRSFFVLPAGLAGAAGLSALQNTSALAGVESGAVGHTSKPGVRGLNWPSDQLLPSFRKPGHLDVAYLDGLSGDDQLTLTTLQGVVNRRRPRLYFVFDDDPTDIAWLETLSRPTTRHDDPMSLIAKYRGEISGAIVYDREVPDTINVATTLAGLEDAVVADADQAATYDLPIVEDLRGRFDDDPLALYRWQFENLYPRCTQRLLTGVPPTRTTDVPDVEWREVLRESEQVRDNSNRDVYDLDVSAELGGEAVYVGFHDAFTNDGWGASVARVTVLADGQQIADFAPNTPEEAAFLFNPGGSAIAPEGHRFVDGGAYFIYRFEPPADTAGLVVQVDMWNQYLVRATDRPPTRVEAFPNFRDYITATRAMVFWLPPGGAGGELMTEIFGTTATATPYLGWFSGAVAGEHSGVGLASMAGMEVLAADYYMNGTVHSGAPVAIRPRPPQPKVPGLANKIYVTFTFGEGDNIQYCQHRMRSLWDHEDRGAVPMNWTIDPLLRDIGPAIYRYYQKTATRNDLLIAGPSGAGYTYPGLWPEEELDAFTTLTGRYMRATGLNVISCFNNVDQDWTPLTEQIGKSYRDHTPALGMVLGWEHGNQFSVPGGMPVIGDFARFAGVEDYRENLVEHVADWDGAAPRFVACAIQAWQWTPAEVAELAALLDDRFEVVRGDVFFELLRKSLPRAE